MTGIELTNLGEVIAGMKARAAKVEQIPKVAKQMGILACNEIHPLTNKKTGNWDNSIHAEVSSIGQHQYVLWVGSKGAFNGSGYNYGARQERLFHPIEIGWNRAQAGMKDLWQTAMKGNASSLVSGPDEFASMAGF